MKRSVALSEMHPLLKQRALVWENFMAKKGLAFVYTSVGRLFSIQVALFAQGREILVNVNHYRKLAGLNPLLTEAENKIVTWTLNSYHIIKLDDAIKFNDKSRAFDFALLDHNGKAQYDVKADVNVNQIPDYEEAGSLAVQAGMGSGAFFKNAKGNPRPDYPHVQLSKADLKAIGEL